MLLVLPFIGTYLIHFLALYGTTLPLNEIIGDPAIACTENGIKFQISTSLPFHGRIYVQGKVDDAYCSKVAQLPNASATKPFILLLFDTCGMESQYSNLHVRFTFPVRNLKEIFRLKNISYLFGVQTNPRGVYYATNIVVSFHEVLVTKSDKSFRARCFFPELTQPLDQSLEVMTKAPQEFLTYSKSPACVYSMHNATFKVVEEGRSIGPALGSAQIGDLILHKWSCPDRDPIINCTEHGIRFQVNTRLPFNGRIFAQGKVEDADCVKVYSEGSVGSYDNGDRGSSTKPFMDLGFETCGMDAVVSTEPHGIYFSVKLTVSFHRLLITKNDKFFKAKCFFAETRTSISQRLEVRNSDPIEYLTSHHTSPCNYAMYNASYGTFEGHRDLGPPLTYAQVGDRILHVWSCPDHFYGIMVYDCYVTDGYLQNLTVVDDKGCSSNYELVSNVRYGRGLHEAYAESQVFKFAEKPVVYFHCRIEECDVNKTETCPSFMQPHCDYNHHPSTKLAPIDAAPPAFNPSRSGPYSGDVPVTDGFSQQLLRSDNFVESASVDSFTASEESAKMNLKRRQKFSLTLLDNPLDGEKIGISVRNNQQNRLGNRLLQQQRSTKQPIFQNVKGHLIVLDSGEETKTLPVRKSQKEEEFEGETVKLMEERSQSSDQCLITTTETLIVVFVCYTFVCIFSCIALLVICRKICRGGWKNAE